MYSIACMISASMGYRNLMHGISLHEERQWMNLMHRIAQDGIYISRMLLLSMSLASMTFTSRRFPAWYCPAWLLRFNESHDWELTFDESHGWYLQAHIHYWIACIVSASLVFESNAVNMIWLALHSPVDDCYWIPCWPKRRIGLVEWQSSLLANTTHRTDLPCMFVQ